MGKLSYFTPQSSITFYGFPIDEENAFSPDCVRRFTNEQAIEEAEKWNKTHDNKVICEDVENIESELNDPSSYYFWKMVVNPEEADFNHDVRFLVGYDACSCWKEGNHDYKDITSFVGWSIEKHFDRKQDLLAYMAAMEDQNDRDYMIIEIDKEPVSEEELDKLYSMASSINDEFEPIKRKQPYGDEYKSTAMFFLCDFIRRDSDIRMSEDTEGFMSCCEGLAEEFCKFKYFEELSSISEDIVAFLDIKQIPHY